MREEAATGDQHAKKEGGRAAPRRRPDPKRPVGWRTHAGAKPGGAGPGRPAGGNPRLRARGAARPRLRRPGGPVGRWASGPVPNRGARVRVVSVEEALQITGCLSAGAPVRADSGRDRERGAARRDGRGRRAPAYGGRRRGLRDLLHAQPQPARPRHRVPRPGRRPAPTGAAPPADGALPVPPRDAAHPTRAPAPGPRPRLSPVSAPSQPTTDEAAPSAVARNSSSTLSRCARVASCAASGSPATTASMIARCWGSDLAGRPARAARRNW